MPLSETVSLFKLSFKMKNAAQSFHVTVLMQTLLLASPFCFTYSNALPFAQKQTSRKGAKCCTGCLGLLIMTSIKRSGEGARHGSVQMERLVFVFIVLKEIEHDGLIISDPNVRVLYWHMVALSLEVQISCSLDSEWNPNYVSKPSFRRIFIMHIIFYVLLLVISFNSQVALKDILSSPEKWKRMVNVTYGMCAKCVCVCVSVCICVYCMLINISEANLYLEYPKFCMFNCAVLVFI